MYPPDVSELYQDSPGGAVIVVGDFATRGVVVEGANAI